MCVTLKAHEPSEFCSLNESKLLWPGYSTVEEEEGPDSIPSIEEKKKLETKKNES